MPILNKIAWHFGLFDIAYQIMSEELNLKQLIEWYIAAGVEETAGDVPFAPPPASSAKPSAAIPAASAQTSESGRRVTTVLAQATIDAGNNARDLCKSIGSLEELKALVEGFDGCSLKFTASHTVFGDGNPKAKVVFIGEAPGADEDRIGRPFVGRSGQLLDKMMSAAGLSRGECYITNVLPWRPPGNRTPTDGEIAVCLPFLKRQIDLINPDYLFILGGSAANALLEMQESISRLRGRWLDYKNSTGKNIQVLASFHPAYLLRNPGQKAKAWVDLLRLSKKISEEAPAE